MTSLKRILNSEDHVEDGIRPGLPIWDLEDESCDIPVLEELSYPDLWTNLLDLDLSQSTLDSDFSQFTPDFDGFEIAEDNIQAWASQTMPGSSTESCSDDDMIFSQQIENSGEAQAVVCYGMIYRQAVKLMGNMSEVDSKIVEELKQTDGDDFSFEIRKGATETLVTFKDGQKLGILNNQASKAVQAIIGPSSIQLEAYADLMAVRETIFRAKTATEATVRVNINVYGSPELQDQVGKGLSEAKVYLQHPDHHRPGSEYRNPHFLTFPDFEAPNSDFQLLTTIGKASKSSDGEQFRKAVSDVYATLKRSANLDRVKADARVTTNLLEHQEQALNFMLQREGLHSTGSEFSLWQRVEDRGSIRHRHKITLAELPAPPTETGGGILADEMGMGKTLSILSLLAKTLDNAHNWAEDPATLSKKRSAIINKASRGTLVIVSSILVLNIWLSEIDKHLNGTLKVTKYHGRRREKHATAIADSDIVLTTYHTLATDLAARKGPLREIFWYRVVLDEAHTIRRRTSTLYRAVVDLHANSRWCLSGTPIQNRLEDIGALFAFIGVVPFDSIAIFRKYISIPFEGGEEGRAIASTNLGSLIDAICLRRTKELIRLPNRREKTNLVVLSKAERTQYEQTAKIMGRAIRQKASQYGRGNLFGIFQAQLQLRILCNHGTFQRPFSWANPRNTQIEREEALCSAGQNGWTVCFACKQSMPLLGTNRVYRAYSEFCRHVICFECLGETSDDLNDPQNDNHLKCPICRPVNGYFSTIPDWNEQQENYFEPDGHSSKVTALTQDIQEDLWMTKSIVFSTWTKTLNLIETHFRRYAIPFERIDGESPLSRRQGILDKFSTDPLIPVLIMTTGVGAYGLNLTAANRVFIVEPQWNPSVENQAIARAMRLGQEQSVLVVRYVVDKTVEQEMRSQQDLKRTIAKLGWDEEDST